jgi:hypothetical protein
MLQIVRCENCKEELSWSYKDDPKVMPSIELVQYAKPCNKCYHARENRKTLSFCSIACMKKYVKDMKETYEQGTSPYLC